MKNILLIVIIAVSILACDKVLEIQEPDLNIQVDETEYHIGDTVKFEFSGTADFVTFFSGEPGREFQYKDRTFIEGLPKLQFTTYNQATQPGSLKLLVSKDLTE